MKRVPELPAHWTTATDVLTSASWYDAPAWKPHTHPVPGKVLRVHDGDVLDIAICETLCPLAPTRHAAKRAVPKVVQIRLRLAGLDAPNGKSRNEAEKRLARHVNAHLTAELADALVLVRIDDMDIYGRFVGTVWIPCAYPKNRDRSLVCLNTWMLEHRLAKPSSRHSRVPFDARLYFPEIGDQAEATVRMPTFPSLRSARSSPKKKEDAPTSHD